MNSLLFVISIGCQTLLCTKLMHQHINHPQYSESPLRHQLTYTTALVLKIGGLSLKSEVQIFFVKRKKKFEKSQQLQNYIINTIIITIIVIIIRHHFRNIPLIKTKFISPTFFFFINLKPTISID